MVVCPDEMDASYLDELEEFVKDDGRIVTYKWLSLTLCVPSNVAKQMLHHYASSHQQEGQGTKPPISVTYLVSGLLKDDEGKVKKGEASTSTLKKVVWLVDERDLSAARESLCAITSVHIYSVQKTAPQDLATLYAAHYDKAKEHISDTHKYSGVSCTFARVNPAGGRIQQVIAEAEPPTEKPSQNTRVAANPSAATTTATTTATAAATTAATTAATKPSSQIASMFAQQAKKVDAPKKTIVKEEKPPIKKSPGGISAFFTKGAAAPRKAENSEKKKEEIKEEIKEEKEEVKEEIKELKKKEKDLFVIGKTAEEKAKKSKASTSTQKKRKSQRKEADEPKVKRSRILQISDSESEEEEKEEEEEDLLLLPPPPPSPPLTQTIQSDEEEEEEEKKKEKEKEEEEDRKGKKKIMVDETFMDEDGYLVTNKVYKYVDLTEEEIKEEEKERKEEEEKRKKREEEAKKREEERRKKEEEAGSSPSSPQKKKRGKKDDGKKQSSIMSFFGKK